LKIICIDHKDRAGDYAGSLTIKEGCIYTATCTCMGYGKDGSVALSYKLKEFDQKYCWDCDRFIPLSGISETGMQRTYKQRQHTEPAN
jgi:hypothetical protein